MGLNKEQQLAVDSNAKKICCLAAAGSGKTTVLISRISRLISDGVLPNQILALTFTVAAAAEMRERFEAMHPGMISPEFRTFHSFSYSLLCKDWAVRHALGYDSIPEIASDEFEEEIRARVILQCHITLTREQLRYRVGLNRQQRRQAELFDKAYSRLMKREDQITFDMLNSEVAELFASKDPSTIPYTLQYKYICTDEYQDTDEAQVKFLSAFEDSNIFVVGDAQQNIYGFRGCTNEYIKKITADPAWTKIRLYENYRSTQQICDYANAFSMSYADESYYIAMHSDRSGSEVITQEIDGPQNYEAIDIDDVELMLNDLTGLSGTSAILCRTNKEVSAICDYLKVKDIPYMCQKETRAMKLIECALSDEFLIGYLASHLTSAKYGEFIRLQAQHPNDVQWFLSTYKSNKKIESDAKKIMTIRDLATLLIPMDKKIKEIRKALRLKNLPVPEDDSLFGIEFLNWLKDAAIEVKENELYVGTIHSVKGLEYDNVCVANVGSYCFRLGSEEMNNLFYVAITRAKNRLFVYRIGG